METKVFLTALDDDAIAKAIGAAERQTSGEIRVFISEREIPDAVAEGQKQFVRLGMARTEQRNGVLIYVAPKTQAFSIIGDEGIHQRCGQPFWEEVTRAMLPLLKGGRFTEAILCGIDRIGAALAREFPFRHNDRNELPNHVEREKE